MPHGCILRADACEGAALGGLWAATKQTAQLLWASCQQLSKSDQHDRTAGLNPTSDANFGRTVCKATPVGFEPTRGDPIGLAGRRLSRSAKVSLRGHTDTQLSAIMPIPRRMPMSP